VDALTQLVVQIPASDPDIPTNRLTFSMTTGPSGATLDADTGRFVWTPTLAQAPSTNQVIVIVSDDGVPQLSAIKGFRIVARLVAPQVTINLPDCRMTSEGFHLSFNAKQGWRYIVEASGDLLNWAELGEAQVVDSVGAFVDSGALTRDWRYYRVRLDLAR
jgi:hypothetical protein